MQDKYVGDVGDFGKYLLLKKIIESARSLDENIRLGINWYYVKYEKGKGSDGRHIDYLRSTNKKSLVYKDCDLDLYRELGRIVRTDELSRWFLADSPAMKEILNVLTRHKKRLDYFQSLESVYQAAPEYQSEKDYE
ncbi:MAG: hypothetical protein ABSC57_00320 [Syntrophales bacterium]